jgi:transposase
MSEIEIITDGGRRRRWTAAEELRIVEETLDDRASISVVARRNGVAPNLLYRWRRLMLEGGSVAVSEDDDVTSNKVVRQMEDRSAAISSSRSAVSDIVWVYYGDPADARPKHQPSHPVTVQNRSFHRFGSLHLKGPNPPPIQPRKQRLELRVVHQHQPVLDGRPGEAVLFQPLVG